MQKRPYANDPAGGGWIVLQCLPENAMPTSSKRVSRLHSKDPADAAWRARQAQVDADIEGLSRDPGADRLAAEMAAEGVAPRQRIERLKAYFRVRQNPKLGET
jgi:hypothetical protein